MRSEAKNSLSSVQHQRNAIDPGRVNELYKFANMDHGLDKNDPSVFSTKIDLIVFCPKIDPYWRNH